MKHIAAVVVTYNRCELLQESISCLQRQILDVPGYALDVLVIDNASTDGTSEAVAEIAARDTAEGASSVAVRYFNTGENLGGAGGFNWGIRQAVEDGYDFAWIMDDDCQPHPDALREFLIAAEALEGKFGFLSSVVKWVDGNICRMNVQRHPLTKDIENFDLPLQPCTLASFVSLFIPTHVVLELGLPIKDFFVWSDDWEYTRRLSRQYPCYVVGGSVVTHASRANVKGTIVDCDPERIDRYRLIYRNDVYWYRREGLSGWSFLLTRYFFHLGKVLAFSSADKGKKIKIITQSNIDGLKFDPPIEYIDPAQVRPIWQTEDSESDVSTDMQ